MEVLAKLPSTEQRDRELTQLLKALGAFRRGEGGVTLPTDWDGIFGKLAAEFNELSAQTARTSHRLKAVEAATRLGSKSNRRVLDEKLTGFWQDNIGTHNLLVDEMDAGSENTRALLKGLTDLKKGNTKVQLPPDWPGVFG
ncbi:MAG: hypothetical protein ACJ8GO_09295, partial [Ramlibacter sp.]